jgi:hypothetical protein
VPARLTAVAISSFGFAAILAISPLQPSAEAAPEVQASSGVSASAPVLDLAGSTETSTTHLQPDGSYRLEASLEAANYRDDDGEWQPNNNDLVEAPGATYPVENAENAFTAQSTPGGQAAGTSLDIYGHASGWRTLNATSFMNNWKNGTWPRAGIVIRPETESTPTTNIAFASGGHPTAANRPDLVVNYTEASNPLVPASALPALTVQVGTRVALSNIRVQLVSQAATSDGDPASLLVLPSSAFSMSGGVLTVSPAFANLPNAYLDDEGIADFLVETLSNGQVVTSTPVSAQLVEDQTGRVAWVDPANEPPAFESDGTPYRDLNYCPVTPANVPSSVASLPLLCTTQPVGQLAAAMLDIAYDQEGAANVPGTTPTDPSGFWVVGNVDETFQQRVINGLQANPSTASAVDAGLSSMLTEAQNGDNLTLPGAGGTATQDASVLTATRNAVANYQPGTTTGSDDTSYALSAGRTPTNYPKRGFPQGTGRKAWQLPTAIAADFCTQDCVTTDRIDVGWIFDPGRSADRIQFNARYFPNDGNFDKIYALVGTYLAGSKAATKYFGKNGPQDGSGSGSGIIRHRSSANQTYEGLVRLQAHFKPNNSTKFDRARTAKAFCGGGDDRNCTFSNS